MSKYAVWVEASERLPDTVIPENYICKIQYPFGEVSHQTVAFAVFKNGQGWTLPIQYTTGKVIEWLDESPVDRGVEKAAEDALKIWEDNINPHLNELISGFAMEHTFPVRGHIRLILSKVIAGAKWAGNDAVEFVEWAAKHYAKFAYYKDEKVDNMWFELSDPDNVFTTGQLYNLFKQKQL